MRPLGSAEENEMILAFLQAEIDSPRYGVHYARMLSYNHLSRSVLIDNADLSDTQGNYFRKELLRAVRGYASNVALFIGFPSDVIWRRVLIEQSDYPRLKYMNDPSWVEFSGRSRLVTEGAKNLERTEENRDPRPNVNGILLRIGEGQRLAPLIAVESGDGFLILIEGHSRATAYVASGLVTEFEMFVGSSPAMHNWRGF
jgi:hypothetical protein